MHTPEGHSPSRSRVTTTEVAFKHWHYASPRSQPLCRFWDSGSAQDCRFKHVLNTISCISEEAIGTSRLMLQNCCSGRG